VSDTLTANINISSQQRKFFVVICHLVRKASSQ